MLKIVKKFKVPQVEDSCSKKVLLQKIIIHYLAGVSCFDHPGDKPSNFFLNVFVTMLHMSVHDSGEGGVKTYEVYQISEVTIR
jgi:hypothetical protein